MVRFMAVGGVEKVGDAVKGSRRGRPAKGTGVFGEGSVGLYSAPVGEGLEGVEAIVMGVGWRFGARVGKHVDTCV